jgi:hypothetical protein
MFSPVPTSQQQPSGRQEGGSGTTPKGLQEAVDKMLSPAVAMQVIEGVAAGSDLGQGYAATKKCVASFITSTMTKHMAAAALEAAGQASSGAGGTGEDAAGAMPKEDYKALARKCCEKILSSWSGAQSGSGFLNPRRSKIEQYVRETMGKWFQRQAAKRKLID